MRRAITCMTWLLRIVGASPAHTSMALTCPWRSRPQHHKRTSQNETHVAICLETSDARPGDPFILNVTTGRPMSTLDHWLTFHSPMRRLACSLAKARLGKALKGCREAKRRFYSLGSILSRNRHRIRFGRAGRRSSQSHRRALKQFLNQPQE
jgi:hypothetical protein